MKREQKDIWLLILAGAGMEAGYLFIRALGDLRFNLPFFLGVFSILFLLYFFLVLRVRDGAGGSSRSLLVILLFSLIFRVTTLLSTPSLSDDIYRYLWEGNLVLNGENPFTHAPDDPALIPYRGATFHLINHKEISTIYPPVAQFLFAVSQAVARHPLSMKGLFMIGDLLVVLLLWRILLRRKEDPRRVLFYAWNPLPVMEFSGAGHVDGLAVGFLLLSLYLLAVKRSAWAWLSLSLSILTKYFSVCLVPLYWLREKKIGLLLILCLSILLAYLPFIGAGTALLEGGKQYTEHWRYNGSVFDLVVWVTGSLIASKALIAVAFLAAAVILPLRFSDPFRVAFVLAGLYVVLSPTLHPWYVTWVLPFLCLFPRYAWLYLSGAVVVSYWILGDYAAAGVWKEAPWVRVVEYAPFYALLAMEAVGLLRFEKEGSRKGVDSDLRCASERKAV